MPKQASRRNAIHKLSMVMDEDRAAYEDFSRRMFLSLKPIGEKETQLVQTIIDCHWRLNRATALEADLLTRQYNKIAGTINTGDEEVDKALIQAAAFGKESKSLADIAFYCDRIADLQSKSHKALSELQARRQERNSGKSGEWQSIC